MPKTINFFQQGLSLSELKKEFNRLFTLEEYHFNSESEKALVFLIVHGNAYIEAYTGNKDELDILLNFYLSAIPNQYNPLPHPYRYLTNPVVELALTIFNQLENINPQSKSKFIEFGTTLTEMRNYRRLDDFIENIMNLKSKKVSLSILRYLSQNEGFKLENHVKLSLLTELSLDRKLPLIECVINRVLKKIENETLDLDRLYNNALWLAESYTSIVQNKSKRYEHLQFKLMELSSFIHKHTLNMPKNYLQLSEKYDAIGKNIYGSDYLNVKKLNSIFEQKVTFKDWTYLKHAVSLNIDNLALPSL